MRVFKFDGTGIVAEGFQLSGSLRKGDDIVITLSDTKSKIARIEFMN